MKKITAILLMGLMLFSGIPALAGSPDNVAVILDGTELSFDVPAQIISDRTMVPMRGIFEALGAEVSWDSETYTASGVKDGVKVSITIGENKVVKEYADGTVEEIEIDVPAQIVGDRTLVPVRAISESFDCEVGWDGETYTVLIGTDEDEESQANVYVGLKNFIKEKGETIDGGGYYKEYDMELSEDELLICSYLYDPFNDTIVLFWEGISSSSLGIMDTSCVVAVKKDGSLGTIQTTTQMIVPALGYSTTVLESSSQVEAATWTGDTPLTMTEYSSKINGLDVSEALGEAEAEEGRVMNEQLAINGLNQLLISFEEIMTQEGLSFTAKDLGFLVW